MSSEFTVSAIFRAVINTLRSCMEMQRRINRFHTSVR